MNNQVETKKVRWEDLEIAEEQDHLVIDWVPSLIEDIIANWHRPQVERWYIMPGLGDEAAQVHQALCGEITEWEEGNEPVPTRCTRSEVAEEQCACGCTQEERFIFNRDLYAETVARCFDVSPEDIKEGCSSDMSDSDLVRHLEENSYRIWIGGIGLGTLISGSAFCTPSRNNLTSGEE